MKGSQVIKKFLPILILASLISGCAKQQKEPKNMSLEELREKITTALNSKKSHYAIEPLEQVILKYPEHQDLAEYKIILADLYLKVGRLEEAYKLFKNYTKYYPSDARAEESHYKSVLSKFYQTLKVSKSCDDSDTQKTIKRCKDYLTNSYYAQYKNDIRDIQYTCERRLIDKEIYVFNTYIKKGKFQSAQNRLEYLKENYLPRHNFLEAQLLYLEGRLAKEQKNISLTKEKVEQLANNFPDSQYTKQAQGLLSAKRFFFV